MIVDYSYYSTVYMGVEADAASFPALCARAEDVIGAMTRWQATEENLNAMHTRLQTLVKKAICAQVDYFAVNGLDSVAGGNDRGFTVGKVSIQAVKKESKEAGGMANHISPMAKMYLEQSGLMAPQVATFTGLGWW